MARFRYAPVPREVLCDPGLSWTMKGRYGLLLGAAFNKEILDYSLAQIAELWSEAEGEEIETESVGAYLGQMVQLRLIRREQEGRYRWRTRLLKRYVTQQPQHSHSAATATAQPQHSQTVQSASQSFTVETPMLSRGLEFETPIPSEGLSPGSGALINNTAVDDVVSSLNQQQQHIFRYLSLREVLPKAALDFALKRVSLWEAVGWGEYAWARRRQLNNYAGLIVARLGVGDPAPEVTLNHCPMCGLRECCNECGFYAALDADEG